MPRQKAHLITGATGFVGAALTLELVQRSPDPVVAIVRPGTDPPTARLVRALRGAAAAYAIDPAKLANLEARVFAIAGDITASACAVEPLPAFDFQRFWHCAASLRFENRYASEIHRVNVDGTRHALDLAHHVGVEVFNHISTAYVAGAHEGLVAAGPVVDPAPNNLYEASKIAGESLVVAAPMTTRILRPSVIIGHSETLAATTFSGLYGFLRQLYNLQRLLARTQPDLLTHHRLQILGDPEAPLDLVTIDQVAAEAVQIGLAPRGGGYFHLTQTSPPTVGAVVEQLTQLLSMASIRWVDRPDTFEWLDEKFNQRIDFYRSYLRGRKHFDRRSTAALVAAPLPPWHVDTALVRRIAAWYLRQLQVERQGLPRSR